MKVDDDPHDYASTITTSKERLEEKGANVEEFKALESRYDLSNSAGRKDLAQDLNRVAKFALAPITKASEEAIEAGNNYLDKDLAELEQEHGQEATPEDRLLLSHHRILERAEQLAREYGAQAYNDLRNQDSATREDIFQSFEDVVIGEPEEPQHELIDTKDETAFEIEGRDETKVDWEDLEYSGR
jgi:hypothetical protein